mmetsp:Transcript_49838/g.156920  ORF Transcript_49838/g.156920 Transcript_49838/m.156920 type:complete len:85 (+) Transcript_49838:119-373(+)
MGDLRAQAYLKKVEDMVVATSRSAADDPHKRNVATMLGGLDQASMKFRVKAGVVMAKNAKIRGEVVDLPYDIRGKVAEIMANER